MNWVLILVILILAANVRRGYKRGMLRMAYSMVSWIIVLVCVSWATPYISQYLMENTTIYQTIQKQCEETIRNAAASETSALLGQESNLSSQGDSSSQGDTFSQNGLESQNDFTAQSGLASPSGLASQSGLASSSDLASLGMNIPDSVLESIIDDTVAAAGDFLDQSGIYSNIAAGLAKFVLDGISFLCASLFSWLIVNIISQVLGIVSHIPVLSGMNRTLGLFAGGIYGLIVVWIAFYIVALCNATDMGKIIVSYIYESRLLTFLYENNLVLTLILKFF